VQHCRQSVPASSGVAGSVRDHCVAKSGWFDIVTGPVAAFWEQRVLMKDADQISFHTVNIVDPENWTAD
jgi:hypothetical protein